MPTLDPFWSWFTVDLVKNSVSAAAQCLLSEVFTWRTAIGKGHAAGGRNDSADVGSAPWPAPLWGAEHKVYCERGIVVVGTMTGFSLCGGEGRLQPLSSCLCCHWKTGTKIGCSVRSPGLEVALLLVWLCCFHVIPVHFWLFVTCQIIVVMFV